MTFTYETIMGLSNKEFKEAVSNLIDKGIVEEVIIDGEVEYKVTYIGLQIYNHLYSDKSEQN